MSSGPGGAATSAAKSACRRCSASTDWSSVPPSADAQQRAHPAEELQVEVEHLAVAAHERARQQPSHGPGQPEQQPERPPQAQHARRVQDRSVHPSNVRARSRHERASHP